MQNLTEILQCVRRWHRKLFIGHTVAIQAVRALPCACFHKECVFYSALGLGVYGCTCARSTPQDEGLWEVYEGLREWDEGLWEWAEGLWGRYEGLWGRY